MNIAKIYPASKYTAIQYCFRPEVIHDKPTLFLLKRIERGGALKLQGDSDCFGNPLNFKNEMIIQFDKFYLTELKSQG